jgi:hypothetical protein
MKLCVHHEWWCAPNQLPGTATENNLGGRARVACEGLNCTLSGTNAGVRAFAEQLRRFDQHVFGTTDFKYVYSRLLLWLSQEGFPTLPTFCRFLRTLQDVRSSCSASAQHFYSGPPPPPYHQRVLNSVFFNDFYKIATATPIYEPS